jgi:serine/threonine protein kinase
MFINYALLACFSSILDFPFKCHLPKKQISEEAENLSISGACECWNKEEIGSGGQGCIYSMLPKEEIAGILKGTSVALKEVQFEGFFKEEIQNDFEKEVENLAFFKGNKHFLQIYAWGISKNTGFIITERAKFDLKQYLETHDIPAKKKLEIARTVVRSVISLHSNNYVHLDLKWANYLCFDKECNLIKLGDFGFAQNDDKVEYAVGTECMMAPEIKGLLFPTGKTCDGKAADVYSLGIMLKELFGKDFAFIFNSLTADDPSDRPKIEKVLDVLDECELIARDNPHFLHSYLKAKNK